MLFSTVPALIQFPSISVAGFPFFLRPLLARILGRMS